MGHDDVTNDTKLCGSFHPKVDYFPITACPAMLDSFHNIAVCQELEFLFVTECQNKVYLFIHSFNDLERPLLFCLSLLC